MAKLLDALRNGDARRYSRSTIESHANRPDIKLVVEEEIEESAEEEYSYIEVDGATKTINGSPDVLAISPHARKEPEAEEVEQDLVPFDFPEEAVGDETDLENEESSVIFEPWNGSPTIPALARDIVVFHQPNHPLSREYSAIMNQLVADNQETQTLLFTSLSAQDGVLCSMLNLAVAACIQHEKMVAVLDCNIYQPSLHRWLGLNSRPGLKDILIGRMGLEQSLQPTALPNLYALTVEESPWTELTWTPDALRWINSWLRQRFDLVLINAPAWENDSPMHMLVPLADSIFPVLNQGENNTPAMRQMMRGIQHSGGHVRGVIYTKAQAA